MGWRFGSARFASGHSTDRKVLPAMNRRTLVKTAAAPMIASPRIFGANSRLKIGVIGVGGRARWLMQYFGRELDDVDLVAVADCYLARCYNKDPRQQRGTPLNDGWERWAKYDSYQKMLDKEKLDAVWVETTTHARARAAIHVIQAGVDVYAEKPIHLTVEEGRTLVRAARKYNRVLPRRAVSNGRCPLTATPANSCAPAK